MHAVCTCAINMAQMDVNVYGVIVLHYRHTPLVPATSFYLMFFRSNCIPDATKNIASLKLTAIAPENGWLEYDRFLLGKSPACYRGDLLISAWNPKQPLINSKWLFQLDDEPNLYIYIYRKWLEITQHPSILNWWALGFQEGVYLEDHPS